MTAPKAKPARDMMAAMWPNNCALIERTVGGRLVGRCWFPLKNGRCPRHGTKTSGMEELRKASK